ncbi:alpha/beta hydrolase [Catenovulum agarivorans]|uniref:alpha/beta hydrolase n=1 Tax=Catenovulum agarivorans TaxID=1172192 RepID=UPI0009E33651|nr:alpha/beta hydrolase [Catenovulum agarivorans]
MPTSLIQQTCLLNHGKSVCYLSNFNLANIDSNIPTIVCIHGWLDNAESFLPMSEYFSEYQLIIIELIGHGHSDHRSLDAHYHLIDWVYDLKLFCQQLNLPPFYLIGHSLGGAVSTIFAVSESDFVKSLVLLESPGAFTQPERELATNIHLAFESRIKMAEKRTKSSIKKPLNLLPALIQMRVEKNQLEAHFAQALIERNLYLEHNCFSWRSDQRLQTLSPIRLTPNQAQELLSSIFCPIHVCLAKQGYTVIRKTVEQYIQFAKKAFVKEFLGSHHFHMPQAQAVAEYIKTQVIKEPEF